MRGKFNCITINFDRTQHSTYVVHISLELQVPQSMEDKIQHVQESTSSGAIS